jgi:spoIIIJ-associated protein
MLAPIATNLDPLGTGDQLLLNPLLQQLEDGKNYMTVETSMHHGLVISNREQNIAMNVAEAAAKIETLLQTLLRHSGLRLGFSLSTKQANPPISVIFRGDDVPVLLARNAELLLAFEHIAVKAVGLTSDEHDQVSFDADGFKAARDRHLERAAREAVAQVQATGQPFRFPPMNSRERRLLHLTLASSGLLSASEGEGALRHLVVHPRRDS